MLTKLDLVISLAENRHALVSGHLAYFQLAPPLLTKYLLIFQTDLHFE